MTVSRAALATDLIQLYTAVGASTASETWMRRPALSPIEELQMEDGEGGGADHHRRHVRPFGSSAAHHHRWPRTVSPPTKVHPARLPSASFDAIEPAPVPQAAPLGDSSGAIQTFGGAAVLDPAAVPNVQPTTTEAPLPTPVDDQYPAQVHR